MTKPYAQNRKIRKDYEILDKFEAGLVLLGPEVKSIQAGKISLTGANIKFYKGQPTLMNTDIAPYQPKNQTTNFDPTRPRQLLLKQNEIKKLISADSQKQLTIVPISVYNKKGLIKLEIAVVRRQNKDDKREVLKKKDDKRQMRQSK